MFRKDRKKAAAVSPAINETASASPLPRSASSVTPLSSIPPSSSSSQSINRSSPQSTPPVESSGGWSFTRLWGPSAAARERVNSAESQATVRKPAVTRGNSDGGGAQDRIQTAGRIPGPVAVAAISSPRPASPPGSDDEPFSPPPPSVFTMHTSNSSTSLASDSRTSRNFFRRPTAISGPTFPSSSHRPSDAVPPVPEIPSALSPKLPVVKSSARTTKASNASATSMGRSTWAKSVDDFSKLLSSTATSKENLPASHVATPPAEPARPVYTTPIRPLDDESGSTSGGSSLGDPTSPLAAAGELPPTVLPTAKNAYQPSHSIRQSVSSRSVAFLAKAGGLSATPSQQALATNPSMPPPARTGKKAFLSPVHGRKKSFSGLGERADRALSTVGFPIPLPSPVTPASHRADPALSNFTFGGRRPSATGEERPKMPSRRQSSDRGHDPTRRGSNEPTGLLAPNSSSSKPNRLSQTVVRSGLLLRHAPTSTTGPFRSSKPPMGAAGRREELSRNWKPVKAELKGSKLYLFKPPTDRRADIEAKFPTTVLLPTLQLPDSPSRQPTDDSVRTRRNARAFWGTGKHPDLQLEDQPPLAPKESIGDASPDLGSPRPSSGFIPWAVPRIRSATPEALIHELVFASQTPPDGPLDDGCAPFIDVVMASLLTACPPLRFVADLRKAVERATSAAIDPEEKEDLLDAIRPKVQAVIGRFCDGLSGSWWQSEEATQVKESLGAVVCLLFEQGQDEAERLFDLIDGAGAAESSRSPTNWIEQLKSRPASRSPTRPVLRSLETTMRLSLKALLDLEPMEVAQSIHAFHADLLDAFLVDHQEETTIVRLDSFDMLPSSSATSHLPLHLLVDPVASPTSASPLACLHFSLKRPHFITLLILHHVFVSSKNVDAFASTRSQPSSHPSSPNLSAAYGDGTSSAPSKSQGTSVTGLRSRAVSQWIVIGEFLRASGDAAGFMAVAIALCSRAVLRLGQTWRRIAVAERAVVLEIWLPLLMEAGFQDLDAHSLGPLSSSLGVSSPTGSTSSIPFFGSFVEDARRARDAPLRSGPVSAGFLSFERVSQTWACLENPIRLASSVYRPSPILSEDVVLELASIFQLMASSSPAGPSYRDYFKHSLMAEPPQLGLVQRALSKEPPPTVPSPFTVMLPLLFPESLPTIALIDRDALLKMAREWALPKPGSKQNLAAIATSESGTSFVGLNSGGRKPTHARSLSAAHARTEGLDLALPSLAVPRTGPPATDGRKLFFGSLKDLGGIGDMVLRLCGGRLVLRVVLDYAKKPASLGGPSRTSVVSSAPGSRRTSLIGGARDRDSTAPPSLSASKRLSLALATHRGSMLQRSASSKRISRISIAGSTDSDGASPLRVEVKAGALETLVDVAIFSVDGLRTEVKDDNGLAAKSGRRLAIDLVDYRIEFFSTFHAFTTPLALFEQLQFRFESAPAAVKAASESLPSPISFPDWPLQDAAPSVSGVADRPLIVQLQLSVLSFLSDWFAYGPARQNILDDAVLHAELFRFLSVAAASSDRLPRVQRAISKLEKQIRIALLRPEVPSTIGDVAEAPAPPATEARSSVPALVRIENGSALGLVNDLDSIASSVFSKISTLDLHVAAEHLRLQSLTPLGWLPVHQSPAVSDDHITVSDFTLALGQALMDPSTEGSESALLKRLPMSLRFAFRSQSSVRDWLIAQITDPSISASLRRCRFELLLEALEICRSRSVDPDTIWTATSPDATAGLPLKLDVQPSVRTFVGSAIRSALLSPPSRVFAHTWHEIGLARGSPSVLSLLSLIKDVPASESSECTADLGWYLERLVEVVSVCPDSYDSTSDVLNFDKHRYIHNLISNAAGLVSARTDPARDESSRLLQLEAAISIYDVRGLRDVAGQEARSSCSPGHQHVPKAFRPFQPIVDAQKEKGRRDKIAREKLLRPRQVGSTSGLRHSTDLSKSMGSTKKSKGYTSLLSRIRPGSLGISGTIASFDMGPSTSAQSFESTRTLEELDFQPVSKAVVVVSVVDSRTVEINEAPRSFVFRLRTDEGATHILQAPTVEARDAWIASLAETSRRYSERRKSTMGTALPTDLGLQVALSKNESAVFGRPLSATLQRHPSMDGVPMFLERLLTEIEKRGILDTGIYRLSGAKNQLDSLHRSLDLNSACSITDIGDIHVLTGAVKLWLRLLPDPLVPMDLFDAFCAAALASVYEDKIRGIQDLLEAMPEDNRAVLKRIMEHLYEIFKHEDQNHMSPDNLAVIFTPNLLRPPPPRDIMNVLTSGTPLIRLMISEYPTLFLPPPPNDEPDVSPVGLGFGQFGRGTSSPILPEEGEEEEEMVEEVDEVERLAD